MQATIPPQLISNTTIKLISNKFPKTWSQKKPANQNNYLNWAKQYMKFKLNNQRYHFETRFLVLMHT